MRYGLCRFFIRLGRHSLSVSYGCSNFVLGRVDDIAGAGRHTGVALIAVAGVLTGPAFIACSVAVLLVWAWAFTARP